MYTSDIASVKESKTQPPYILIVTPDLPEDQQKENIGQIIVYLDGHRYSCSSVQQALALTYKSIWLFGVKYHSSVQNVWMVIQKFFFKMSYQTEIWSPEAKQLVKVLSAKPKPKA